MSATIVLGRRALREAVRQPDALFMTMFIPIFFLVVNTGQAAEIFPSESTDFLKGQGYGAFQLPITLLLAASFGMAAPAAGTAQPPRRQAHRSARSRRRSSASRRAPRARHR